MHGQRVRDLLPEVSSLEHRWSEEWTGDGEIKMVLYVVMCSQLHT